MSTPLSDLLSLVAEHGKSQASAFLQGEAVITGSPDQEIWEHLARHDILWDGLTVADQDQIRDSYLEAFKQECARRLTVANCTETLPAASSIFKAVADPCPACGLSGAHYCVPMETSVPSPASSVVPAPLVPEVVKTLEDALKCVKPWIESADRRLFEIVGKGQFCECGCFELAEGFRNHHNGAALELLMIENALTALRNYSPAPSPSVEILREAHEALDWLFRGGLGKLSDEAQNAGMRKADRVLSKLNAALT